MKTFHSSCPSGIPSTLGVLCWASISLTLNQFLCSPFSKGRFLWNVDRIHGMMDMMDSPPVAIQAMPVQLHADLTASPETPDKILNDRIWTPLPGSNDRSE
jgi:hypothetical protein